MKSRLMRMRPHERAHLVRLPAGAADAPARRADGVMLTGDGSLICQRCGSRV